MNSSTHSSVGLVEHSAAASTPPEPCVVRASSSSPSAQVCKSLQEALGSKLGFLWTCDIIALANGSLSQRPRSCVVAIADAKLHIRIQTFSDNDTFSSAQVVPIVRDFQLENVGGRVVRVTIPRPRKASGGGDDGENATSSLTQLQLTFPTEDIKRRFCQHVSHAAMLPVENTAAHPLDETRDGRSSSVTSTATARSVDNSRLGRASAHKSAHGGDDTSLLLLHSSDTDYFHLATNKAFATRARHKWGKWSAKARDKRSTNATATDDTKEKALSTVLLSVDCQLGVETHEVAVVTDVAVFIVKRRDPSVFKAFLPIVGIDFLEMAPRTRRAQSVGGGSGSASDGGEKTEWEVIILLDLQVAVMTLSSDLKLIMDPRCKGLFVSALSRRFEDIKLTRLVTVMQHDNLFWRKRTLLETKLLRVATKMKDGILKISGAADAANKNDEDVAMSVRDLLTDHPRRFVATLCSSGFLRSSGAGDESDELAFAARSLLAASKRCGVTREILFSTVMCEVDRVVALNSRSRQPGIDSGLSFFSSGGLADRILSEYCVNVGEQYLRVMLAQMMEEFVQSTVADEGNASFISEQDVVRYCKELVGILRDSEHHDALFPDALKEILCMIDVFSGSCASPQTGGNGSDGAPHLAALPHHFVVRHFVCKALESPQSHGLVSTELSVTQLRYLQVVSGVLQSLFAEAAAHNSSAAPVVSTVVKRVVSSLAFTTAREQLREQLDGYVRRLSPASVKRDLEQVMSRIVARHPRRQTRAVVCAPLLPSDVPTLRAFHGLIEKKASCLLFESFVLHDELSQTTLAAVSCAPKAAQQQQEHAAAQPQPRGAAGPSSHADDVARLRSQLSAAESLTRQLHAQHSKALEDVHRLSEVVRQKDAEVQRLRTVLPAELLPVDPLRGSIDHRAGRGGSPPAVLLREPHAIRVPYVPARLGLCSELYATSVFGCPLERYTSADTEYSPRDTSYASM